MLSRKYFGFLLTVIALAPAIATRPALGQTISFFRQFTSPGISGATAVAADASGIYVFGTRWPHAGGQGMGGIRKYDSRGNELWSREFREPIGAAADAIGVYVLGFSGNDGRLLVRKYSTGGAELWTRNVEFSAPGGVAADATGVYVAGRDFPPNSTYLRKYSPDGAELWTSQFGDRINLQNPHGLAVDATGIYVLLIAEAPNPTSSHSYFVRKFDSRGSELWTRLMGPATAPSTFAAASPAGFYLVSSNGREYSVRKYEAGGNELWTRQIGTSSGQFYLSSYYISAVTADDTGVYVVGVTSLTDPALPGQCRSGSGGDSFVRKYDPSGAEVWTRQFGTSQATWASGVAVDSSGLYVVGEEGAAQVRDDLEQFGAFAPADPTGGAFLAKFDKAAAVRTGSGPRIFPDCVVNAASYVGGGVAPGEIVTLFGSAIGPPELVRMRVTEDRRLATMLADTRVLFNGVPAPLLYVSDKQSTAIVPYAVAGRSSADVEVEYKGVRSGVITVPVLPSRPGVFSADSSGQGQAAILNQDRTVNSPSNPARCGSIISIFGTGGGEVDLGVVDGQILSGVLPKTSLPVSVFFAGAPYAPWGQGEVVYAGGSPGSVAGLLQVNVRLPDTAGNAVPFLLIIGSHWTVHQVTVALR